MKEFPVIGRAAQGKLYLGFLAIGFLLWRVCTHLVLGGKEFSFRPTSKRRGVWARTFKRSLVPTVKWRECPLEGGAQGSICTVSPKGKNSLDRRRVLYALVQNRHNTGKSEAVVAYNTDQSLGSLGCF